MVTVTESAQRQRLRAAVDRLHAAQLAALATAEDSGTTPVSDEDGGPALVAGEDCGPAPAQPPCDAYAAERQLLEKLGQMGALLLRLADAGAGAEAAALRRRLIGLAVGCGNRLAQLTSLAFELESAADTTAAPAAAAPRAARAMAAPAGEPSRPEVPSPPAPPPPQARPTTSLRAVTDANVLLVDQLRRLMQNVERQESWRRARPGELWLNLLQQVAELFPLAAALEAGSLSEPDENELRRLAADAANYLAFLRFYPRTPTA
jgi:hypothetical protein